MKYRQIIFTILVTLHANAIANQTIELAYSEWPPAYSKELPSHGSQFFLTKKALLDAGFKVKPVWYPNWDVAYKSARLGRNNGTPGWECSIERTKDFYFSDPIGLDVQVFFHRKDMPLTLESFEDLSKIEVIGINEGYFYGKEFDDLIKEGKITTVAEKTEKANFNKLLVGRIDGLIIDKHVGEAFLKTYYSQEQQDMITYHPKPMLTSYLRLLLNKRDPNHKEVMIKFNKSLKKLNLVEDSEKYLDDYMRRCVELSMED